MPEKRVTSSIEVTGNAELATAGQAAAIWKSTAESHRTNV
jgi:hypothetical protein